LFSAKRRQDVGMEHTVRGEYVVWRCIALTRRRGTHLEDSAGSDYCKRVKIGCEVALVQRRELPYTDLLRTAGIERELAYLYTWL
jgi:hypothetical protein